MKAGRGLSPKKTPGSRLPRATGARDINSSGSSSDSYLARAGSRGNSPGAPRSRGSQDSSKLEDDLSVQWRVFHHRRIGISWRLSCMYPCANATCLLATRPSFAELVLLICDPSKVDNIFLAVTENDK
ncbi:hypothetical protein J6590_097063 [Homalodisca vitripennis]|nr:hypothetical protein J6590_097063 [Homalodisca vitripennis]